MKYLPPELINAPSSHLIPDSSKYTTTLGVQWNSVIDHFRLAVAGLPPLESVTKRMLVSDVAKTFDVLGWFSPAIIKHHKGKNIIAASVGAWYWMGRHGSTIYTRRMAAVEIRT